MVVGGRQTCRQTYDASKRGGCGRQLARTAAVACVSGKPDFASYVDRPVITRRQCARGGIESRNHATLIMSGTIYIVNNSAVIERTRFVCTKAKPPSILPAIVR